MKAIRSVGAILFSLCLLSACSGDDKESDATPPVKIAVSGGVRSHPINTIGSAATFSQLTVGIADPAKLLTDVNAEPLAGAELSTDGCDGSATPCAYRFESVDITNVSIGMVSVVRDARAEADRQWMITATGIASNATLQTLKAKPEELDEVVSFVVSRSVEARLVDLINAYEANTALAHGDLEKKGFVIGMALTPNGTTTAPVTDAIVSVGDAAQAAVKIYYLAANGMSLNRVQTSANGFYIIVPTGVSIPLTSLTVAKTGLTFPQSTLGTAPGGVLALLSVGGPTPP